MLQAFIKPRALLFSCPFTPNFSPSNHSCLCINPGENRHYFTSHVSYSPSSFLNSKKIPQFSDIIALRKFVLSPHRRHRIIYANNRGHDFFDSTEESRTIVQKQQHQQQQQQQHQHQHQHQHQKQYQQQQNTFVEKPSVEDNGSSAIAYKENVVSNDAAMTANGQESQKRPEFVEIPFFGRTFSIKGRYILLFVPILWASFGPTVRIIYSQDHPLDSSVFNSLRLLLSSLVFAPSFISVLKARKSNPDFDKPSGAADTEGLLFSLSKFGIPLWLQGGVELGTWVFLGNYVQLKGLEFISAGRAAFLVQMQTVFVPFLAAAVGAEKLNFKTTLCSIIAVLGVFLLSSDKSGSGLQSSLRGDLYELLSALFHAFYVLRLSDYCNRVSSSLLVGTKIFVQFSCSLLWAVSIYSSTGRSFQDEFPVFFQGSPHEILVTLVCIVWMGLFTSALSGYLQTRGQKCVPASEVAVIFATQPLWASAMAGVLLGETMGPKGLLGGATILASTIISSTNIGEKKDKAQ